MSLLSNKLLRVVVGSVLGATALAAQAPQPSVSRLNLQEPIPFDQSVRTGRLANGLRFFVRKNGRPANRIAMRLAVKAGSLFESDDQQGLAHLIEHMAFNGSAHFKPGELVSYFESTGARLGPHVNAYTSFDETVYMLDLPTTPPEIVGKGLTALADFGGGLSLDPVEIDKERGVVIEEWRGRLGAGSRIRDKQIPLLYHRSRYANRLPIGKPDVIRSAPATRLRSFYDTWYRPDRMAIVIVGDIDPLVIENGIRSTFGSLKARAAAAAPPDAAVPLHRDTLVNVTADPEATQSSVQIGRKRRKDGNKLVVDYRRSLVQNLFEQMFNERFGELARKADAGFLGAGASDSPLSPNVEMFALSARVKDGGIAAGLSALEVEGRRVQRFGFTASELDRAKRWMKAFYDRAYNERDKSESGSFAQEYISYFLSNEPSPGIQYEYRLVGQLLPSITLDDVNALARVELGGEGAVVLAVTPQKEGVTPPAEKDLQEVIRTTAKVAVMPWSETTTSRPLVETVPEPAPVSARRELPDIGMTVVRFANGVEAWLKPTDFKNDQILFTMYSPGGASLSPQADFLQAQFATTYVGLSGVGALKATDLEKMLAGKLVSASPFISGSTHGIGGSAGPAELETALQLLYQTFIAPGDDSDAFALMKRQIEASVANRGRSPRQLFGEKIEQVNSSGHFTAEPLTLERVAGLDRTKMMGIYRERFSNAADFTFFMVGAFDLDRTLPLLARYLGTLPSTGARNAMCRDLGVHFPSTIVRAQVEKGREPRSQTAISFFADPPFDPSEQERIGAATTVLETVLRDSLRETLGQTYTVSVRLSQSPPQRGDGHIVVAFGAAPENISAMTDRVLQEVKRLQTEGPSLDLVMKAKEGARRDYETALKQNGYWMRRLQSIHLLGGNPADIVTRAARIDASTPAVVQEAFRKYFPLDRYTIVTLLPEGTRQ